MEETNQTTESTPLIINIGDGINAVVKRITATVDIVDDNGKALQRGETIQSSDSIINIDAAQMDGIVLPAALIAQKAGIV